jgi:lipoprotein-anchoring transpeptidase ErfK/SrfK
MSRKFTAFLAALFISSSLVATAAEAGTSAKESTAQTMQVADFKRGKIVKYASKHLTGSVVVNTKERALYYVLGNGKAVKYKVATPKKGFEWSGSHKVSQKVKWPDWSPPAAMRKRKPELPAYMAGGPDNPLGARAIYLGSSLYRIHGTNEPSSIGKAASSGCIRMLNADVSELYAHVRPGALVVVI